MSQESDANSMEAQAEIYATLEAVNGRRYANLVRYSAAMGAFASELSLATRPIFIQIASTMLGDLAASWGIDLHDNDVRVEFSKNIGAVRQASTTK